MAITRYSSFDKTVNTIAERNAIVNKVNHMTVVVKDAIADPSAGAGKAIYRWDAVDNVWILVSKSTYETISFATEELTITNGEVQLSNYPVDNKIWNAVILNNQLIYADLNLNEVTVSNSKVTGISSDYNGYILRVTYAYGSVSVQINAAIEDGIDAALLNNVKTINGTPIIGTGDIVVEGILPSMKTINGESLQGTGDIVIVTDISGKADITYVDNKITDIINLAPATLDTFGEIAAKLTADEGAVSALTTVVSNKVDKVAGKGLSTEDYTTAEKTKLAGLNNYTLPIASATVLGGVKAGANITINANGVISANDTSVDWSEIQNKPTTASGYGNAVSHSELSTINGGLVLTSGFDIDLRNKTFTFTSTGSFVGSITTLFPDNVRGFINITSGISLDPSYNGKFIKIPKGTNSSTQDIYLIIENVTSNNSATIASFSSFTRMPVPLTLFTNANLEVGDAIQSIIEFGGGDGTKYLADDGFYKPISSGSTYPLTFDDTNNNIIVGDKFNFTNTNHITTNTLNVGSASFNNASFIDKVVNLGLSNTFGGYTYTDSIFIGNTQTFNYDIMHSVAIGNNLNSSYGPSNDSVTIGYGLSAEQGSIKIGTNSSILKINFNGLTLEGYPNIFTGNSASATRLETARTINGVAFDGTSNITITDNTKQPTLVSGTNIKTINGSSILGSGDITISGGATLTNDSTTNSSLYPVFTSSTSGSMTSASVSSSKLYFNPSTGILNATQFNAFSDRNLKENINTIDNSLDIINKLNAVSFNWKDTGVKSYGVIAQELEEVLPELVNTNDEGFKSVNYDGLIGILLAAVQALSKR